MKTSRQQLMSFQTAMCRSTTCTVKNGCYRYRAIPVSNPRIQEYRKFNESGNNCNGFIGLYGRTDIRELSEARATGNSAAQTTINECRRMTA